MRAERLPEFCPPWVQGQTIGWRVHSPIDVELSPLTQHEVAVTDSPQDAARTVGAKQVWFREQTALALDPPSWLSAYQFKKGENWENMFIPNGMGTVEWRLGWTASDCGSIGLLIIPNPQLPELGVEIGLLSARTLERMETTGVSIAICPGQSIPIARGQEIARIIPIHPDTVGL